MKAIDILLEAPFGPDVQRESGLIVPKEVQDQLEAEAAKAREREAAIRAQEQEAADKRARREAKAKEYFRNQADTDANRAREQAEAEKNARRAERERQKFKLQRKQSKPISTAVRTLFGDTFDSEMSNEDFKRWLKKNRQHYRQYVKPFEKVKRYMLVVRVLTLLGVSLSQLNEIWEDYNAVKTLYHMEPPQITQETHDFYMQYLDYQMIKVVIPYLAAACVKVMLAPKVTLQQFINVLKQLRNIMAAGTIATAPTGVTQVGWIPVVIETAVIIGVEYFITNDTFENNVEEYLRAWLAKNLMGYTDEDIARLEKDINLQVEEEKRQALAAEVGAKSDKDRFLELMRKADGGTIY
jgi:hypothetical protein